MQNVLLTRLAVRQLSLATRSRIRCLATHPPNKSGSSSSTERPTPPPAPTQPPAPSPSKSLSLDFSPVEEAQERTGAKSSKDSLSSIERRRRVMGRTTLALLGLGCIAGCVYLGRGWEEDELKQMKLTLENAPSTRIGRTKARFTDLFDFFNKPQWPELLPPPIPNFQKPYTLLLSIDDLLVTSTWDRQNGWRTAKRPGVDYFLAYLSQFYEIVIFTTQNYYTALPIVEKLDPYQFFITYKLFREATRSVDGQIVKDLTYLNRDLSKVILLDTVPEHTALNPENRIIVPKWNGDPQDRGLIAMIPFLESIGIYRPPDVRPILQAYHGKDIPVEYANKEAEGKQNFIEEWKKSGKDLSGSGFTLSTLFLGSGSRPPVPLTYLEQKRKEAQQLYLEEQKYIRENKEQLDRLLEEDRNAAMEQMSGSVWSVISGLAGAKAREQEKELAEKQLGKGEDKKPIKGPS